MNRLKRMLHSMAGGKSLRGAWKEAGFSSEGEAAEAMRYLADSLDPSGEVRDDRSTITRSEKAGAVEQVVIYADGASKGNPGPSAVAAVAYMPTGELLTSVSRKIEDGTNNEAEYKAVLEGLRLAHRLRARSVLVRLDSQLVVKQLSGEYRIKKDELRTLSWAVEREMANFESCTFEHIPREENREADRLASNALK